MPLTCRLCNRVNPDEAQFCCHDGAALAGSRADGPIAVGMQPFPSPFVFPSGRSCRTFDELVLACETHWDEARDLLAEGLLEGFLGGLGRSDLSWAARRSAQAADPDVGLDELLAQLPGAARKPARLSVEPAEVNCGRVSRSADHRFVLRLLNEGMGLIRGTLTCSCPEWLVLGEEGGAPDKVFQFRHDQAIPAHVVGQRLRGFRPPEGRLVIESNGGSTVVLVRVEAPAVVPFAHGVLAGANSPRRLADLTRTAPREAAVHFEDGSVAAWYAVNGWTYPVQGPPASGIAAVQQFYEAVGLAAAPRVELERRTIRLEGAPGAALETAVVLQTSERRAVFAHAATAEPWLKIDRATLAGRTARIPVRVPYVPDRPGEVLRGRVQVTANGNQRFAVEVTLAVLAEAAPAEPDRRGPEEIVDDHDYPAPRPRRGPGLMTWLIVASFFLLALGAAAVVGAVVFLTPPAGGDPASTAQKPADDPLKTAAPRPKPDNTPPKNTPPTPPPGPPPPADAAALARSLDSNDAAERLSALKKLAALGTKAAPALHAILLAMKDGDADFRRDALAALPKIGAPTAADVDVLAQLVGDASFPEGRMYALAALAALGTDARPALAAVRDALKDADPAVKRKAAEALGGMGVTVRDAVRRSLVTALNDADPDVGAAAAAALAKLGPPTKADATDLLLLLRDKAAPARRYAMECLRQMGPDAADFAPELQDAVSHDAAPELRRLAVAALLAVSPDAEPSIDAYTKAVSDSDAEVRLAGVAALAKVGLAHGALPGLIQALGSDDAATAKAAGDALQAAHLDAGQVAEIGRALPDANPTLRLRLLALLKALGPDAAPAVPGIVEVLRGPAGPARRKAIEAAAALGPAARAAGGALDKLLDDDKVSVRVDAATALAAIEGPDAPEAVPVLVAALRVDPPDDAELAAQCTRAIEALGKIGAPAIKAVTDVLENDFTGGGLGTVKGKINADARLAAVKALGAMGAAGDTAKVLTLLGKLARIDPSDDVRIAAKEARARIRKAS